MLIGVMSDIHANIKALDKAVQTFKTIGVDDVYVCGDIVGYGKNPNECCDLIRESGFKTVLGNHDWGLIGRNGLNGFHKSIYDHMEMVSDTNKEWLKALPLVIKTGKYEFTHAELLKPSKFTYMHSCKYSYRNEQFKVMHGKVCFIGHSHFKEIFLEDAPSGRVYHTLIKGNGDMAQYLHKNRALVSVGSVGICCNKTKRRNIVTYNTEKNMVKYTII